MLLPVTVAFLVGLVIGSFLPYLPCLLLVLAVAAGVGLTGLERLGRIPVRLGMALYGALLVGALYWTAYAWMGSGPRLEEVTESSPVRVTGRIVQPVGHAPARMVLVLSIMQLGEGASARSAKGRVRLTWRACGEPLLPRLRNRKGNRHLPRSRCRSQSRNRPWSLL